MHLLCPRNKYFEQVTYACKNIIKDCSCTLHECLCFLVQIVAPFPGYITKSNKGNDEIVIQATGGSLQDVSIYITNINPSDDIPDYGEEGKLVSPIQNNATFPRKLNQKAHMLG